MSRSLTGRGRPIAVCGLVLVVLATLLPVAARPAAAQTDQSSCLAAPATKVKDGFALPSWSDGAGWSSPDQYETIVSGDVDGDGVGELVARNASHVEIFTWDAPYGATSSGAKAHDPTPGQWRAVIPSPGAALQTFSTADGWWDPSWYSTFQLADLDGDGADELLARTSIGLRIYAYDRAMRTWAAPIDTGEFTDAGGWGQGNPWFYETITTGNVDGRPGAEVVARGANGIEVWSYAASGSARGLTRIETPTPVLDDATVWLQPSHYTTIRLADIDGNGRDELLARDAEGMVVYRFEPATSSWRQRETLPNWSDANGWGNEASYSTIATADIDGDGRSDLVGRSAAGLQAWRFVDNPDDGSWESLAPAGGFTNAEGWAPAANYTTIQPGDVLASPGVEMIGRADGGVITYDWVPPTGGATMGTWTVAGGTISDFSDAAGFGPQSAPGGGLPELFRLATIQAVDVAAGQPDLVLGRGATGVLTRRADGSSPSATFPAYTDLSTLPLSPEAGVVDLGSVADQRQRAYWYLNAAATRTFFDGRGQGLLDEFRFPSNAAVWPTIMEALESARSAGGAAAATSAFDPGDEQLQAMNVPRATYDQVLQDAHDWTGSVSQVEAHLLGVEGVKQFLQEGFLDESDLIDTIGANFEGNEQLYAFFADLLWGLIGALAAVTGIFNPAADAALIAAIVVAASVSGAGVAGAMGFFNPNGAADALESELRQKFVDTLCTANRFVDESYGQIVADYGLLTTAGRVFFDTRMTAPGYSRAVTAANAAKALWVWQQFGDAKAAVGVSNMWVGWCGPADTTCKLDESGTADTIWTAPEGGIRYRLIGELPGSEGTDGNCEFDVLANTPDLKALSPDPRNFSSPRHTGGALAGQPFVDQNTGIAGWNLGNKWCGTL